MGIWEQLRATATQLIPQILNLNLNHSDVPSAKYVNGGGPNNFGLTAAVTQVGHAVRYDGARKLKHFVPDPDRREKIGRIVVDIGKFAVESAVKDSLKGVTGGVQVYKIVKEGLKDQPIPSKTSNGNKDTNLKLAMEEMQAKMEKMQEEMNNVKQQNKISTQNRKDSETSKESSGDPSNGSATTETGAKRIMIRSRL